MMARRSACTYWHFTESAITICWMPNQGLDSSVSFRKRGLKNNLCPFSGALKTISAPSLCRETWAEKDGKNKMGRENLWESNVTQMKWKECVGLPGNAIRSGKTSFPLSINWIKLEMAPGQAQKVTLWPIWAVTLWLGIVTKDFKWAVACYDFF